MEIEIHDTPEGTELPRLNGIELHGYFRYPDQPIHEITMRTDAVVLDDLLRVLEDFLKGLGFVIDGSLEIVPNDEKE